MAANAVLGASTARMQVVVSALGVEQTQAKIAALTGQVAGAGKIGGSVGTGAVLMGAAVAAVIVKIGMASVDAYSTFQKFQIAMQSLAGQEAGTRLAHQMEIFGTESAYSAEQVMHMSEFLLATGTHADKLVDRMKMIANLTAAAGGGNEQFGRVAMAIGQIQSMGHLDARHLRELAMSGVSIPLLAKELGTDAGSLWGGKAKNVSADQVMAAFERIVASRGDVQGRLAAENPEIRFRNMVNTITMALVPLGQQIYKLLMPMMSFTEFILRQINNFMQMTHAGGLAQVMLIGLYFAMRPLVIAAIELRIALHAAAQAAMANAGGNVAAASGSKFAGAGAAAFGGPAGWVVSAGLAIWGIYDLISAQQNQQTGATEPRTRSDIENMQANAAVAMSN